MVSLEWHFSRWTGRKPRQIEIKGRRHIQRKTVFYKECRRGRKTERSRDRQADSGDRQTDKNRHKEINHKTQTDRKSNYKKTEKLIVTFQT